MLVNLHYSMHLPERRFPLSKILLALQEIEFNADIQWLNWNFTLIDTGGIEPDSKDVILSQMREQAEIAVATADVILFLVDVKQGLVDADAKVADMLRRSHKPVILVDEQGRQLCEV